MMLSAIRTFCGLLSMTIFLIQAEGRRFSKSFDHGSSVFVRDGFVLQDSVWFLNSTFITSLVSEDIKSTISRNLGLAHLAVVSWESNEKHLNLTICDVRVHYAFVKGINFTFRQEREITVNRPTLSSHLSRDNFTTEFHSNSSVSGDKRSPRLGYALSYLQEAEVHSYEYVFVKCINLAFRQEREITVNRSVLSSHLSRNNFATDFQSNNSVSDGKRFQRLGYIHSYLQVAQVFWSNSGEIIVNRSVLSSQFHNFATDFQSNNSISGGKRSPRLDYTLSSLQEAEVTDKAKDSNGLNLHEAIYLSSLFCLTCLSEFYLPCVLGFFCPTEVIVDGICHINLEGASPVNFRSVIGNSFFPVYLGDSKTAWYKVRLIVVLLFLFFLLPLLFFPNAPFLFVPAMKEITKIIESVIIIISFAGYLITCACFIVNVIGISSSRVTNRISFCRLCSYQRPLVPHCQGLSLPQRITHHLQQFLSVLLNESKKNISHVTRLCFTLHGSISPSSVLGRLLSLAILMLTTPVFIIVLVISEFLMVLRAFWLVSPLCTILTTQMNYLSKHNVSSLRFLGVYAPAILGVITACGIFKTITWAGPLLLSEKSLPYLACFILIFYYLARSYSSFTSKYQELGSMLYKHYKLTFAVTGEETISKSVSLPVVIIPKRLFDRACTELMPIRIMVCKLMFKMTLFLSFVSFIFFSIENSVDTEPAIKSFLTLLGGSLPKIIEIFNSTRQKNIEAIALDEKVRKIVDCFIRTRHRVPTV